MTPAAHIIKNQLTRAGNSACLVTGAGRSLPFFCTLQQTWRKNKSNFTDRQTPIGRVDKDFYLYIGPFDRNILELPEDAGLVKSILRSVKRRVDPPKLAGGGA